MLNNKLRKIFKTYGEIPAKKYNAPLFLCGCMRSGTTFLVDNLSSHPQLLKLGSELNAQWEKLTCADMTTTCSYLNEKDASYDDLYQITNYFNSFVIENKSLKRHLMRYKVKSERKMGRVFYDWDNLFPMNKSPHLTNKILYINALFPQSKILFVFRDIFEQVASIKMHFLKSYKETGKRAIMPENKGGCWSYTTNPISESDVKTFPEDFSILPEMWIRLNYNALNDLSKLDRCIYHIVYYEDLIKDQSKEFSEIFTFLDLDEKYKKEELKIATARIKYKNTSTKGNSLEKWKTILSKDEVDIVNKVINENREKYNNIMKYRKNLHG